MGKKIALLPGHMIDQIAAGEVIENPASVVKELVENSIDAEASNITIFIAAGGKQKIEVVDDGIGMGLEDLSMSVVRHATSKVKDFTDLFAFSTYGFRGEAIASIASISKMQISSFPKQEAQEHGYKISLEAGKIISKEAAARSAGTTTTVESLFYNVPARKNFQKSIQSCANEVLKTVQLLSLSYPNVKISLLSDEKRTDFSDTSLERRIEIVLGKDFVKKSSSVQKKEGPISLKGYLGDPSFMRYNRNGGYLFINRRPVFCPMAFKAIKEGYATHIPEKCFPTFVLFLDLPPKWVDVNVHPQKKEVRLLEEKTLYSFLRDATIESLGRTKEVVTPSPNFSFSPPQIEMPSFFEEVAPKKTVQKSFSFQESVEFVPLTIYGNYLFMESQYLPEKMCPKTSVVVLDLQAILAKCLFSSRAKKGKFLQRLAVPYTIELMADEVKKMEEAEGTLKSMGLEYRILGKTTVAVDAMSSLIEKADLKEIFSEVCSPHFQEKKRARVCVSFARRKKSFSKDEAKILFLALLSMENPLYCPLGKRVYIELNSELLDKFFKRAGLL